MERKKLIVFDMDGVIVDVSRSYRDTVRQTARLFFDKAQEAGRLPDPLFSLKELAAVKQHGGLNNDWELTYHVLALLMSRVELPPGVPEVDGWDLHRRLVRACRVGGLGTYLATAEAPLKRLHATLPAPESPWIRRLSAGDVGSGNVIKQMFQEIYLGEALFEDTYGFPPRAFQGHGLIDHEELLLPVAMIKELAALGRLAIATGRPRSEAEHALDRFDLRPYFQTMLTLDECVAAERQCMERTGRSVSYSKPHPFMLDAIADRYHEQTSERYYIGDMPDDMMAAAKADHDYIGIGVTYATPDRGLLERRLTQAGADRVIADADGLRDALTRT